MPDILQPRRIDAGDRRGGELVGPGPLPDRQLDRHALGIHPLGIKRDQRLQPFARGRAVEAGLLFDRGDAPRAPALQHGLEQRRAVAEAAVEAALGDAEVLGQHLDPHALDAGSRDFRKAGLDPGLASRVALRQSFMVRSHRFLIRYRIANPRPDTLPYQESKSGSETMETDATYRGTVYPWQCDHVGHMNIMWYVGKFDEANWNLFARLGLTPSYLRESGRGMAAVQQNISYKRELLAGDIVEITKPAAGDPRQVDPLPARDAQRRDRRDRRDLRDHRRAHGPAGAQVGAVRAERSATPP